MFHFIQNDLYTILVIAYLVKVNQLRTESLDTYVWVPESFHESCLIQNISVGISGIHASVGQMFRVGETHCPLKFIHPSLAVEDLDEVLD